jgi:hypothetical protein
VFNGILAIQLIKTITGHENRLFVPAGKKTRRFFIVGVEQVNMFEKSRSINFMSRRIKNYCSFQAVHSHMTFVQTFKWGLGIKHRIGMLSRGHKFETETVCSSELNLGINRNFFASWGGPSYNS